MRSYLSLVPVSARVHKRQSRMTRICIILAVFLVTSIFSMVDMWTRGETASMRVSHGDWHISVKNISDSEYAKIVDDQNIKYISHYEELKNDTEKYYHVEGMDIELKGTEESFLTNIMKYPLEGTYPDGSNEIALSLDAKKLLGKEIGDVIVLETLSGSYEYQITGFYKDDSDYNKMIEGFCAYCNIDTFHSICNMSGVEYETKYAIRFKDEKGLKRTISDFELTYELSDTDVEENTGLLVFLGASNSKSMNDFYPLAGICFVIILIAGVFMISGCMNSNVAQRIKFYGILRCIGASRTQIIRFVRLEALNWCKTAVPIGLFLGTVTSWILCGILKYRVKGEWINMPLFGVSVCGLISGAVVGIITVYIAAYFPAKQAASISPIAAVSGSEQASKMSNHVGRIRSFKVETTLGIYHAINLKKNLILMTGSFSLVIVLFFIFSACLDIVTKLLPSQSNFTPDIVIASQDYSNSIDKSVEEEIACHSGVESTFGLMMSVAFPVQVNGKEATIDLYSYDNDMFKRSKKSIISGDISKVYGNSDYSLVVFNQDSHLNVGDKIKVGNNEIEIACVSSDGVGSISGTSTVVVSEETYARIIGENKYAMLGAVFDNNMSEEDFEQIKALAGNNVFRDNREENEEMYSSYWVFRIAAYSFLAIITMITVLNIANSVSMGVSARIKQYGVMRAIGMETRQITRMIAAEAMAYAVLGIVVGGLMGVFFHYTIYDKVIITHFGGSWDIPFKTMLIIILLVIGSCAVAVYSPAKRIRKMSITETINET